MSDARERHDHVQRNRAAWDRRSTEYRELGRRGWASDDPSWGIWNVRERDVNALPAVAGKDAIELGCGTAYWSAWLARRGARVVAIDNSARQLDTARELQKEHGLPFPLIHGDAERVPLPDASFDLAFSEYGASLWCDPHVWIPEAARLLRAGGDLVFLRPSVIQTLCVPDADAAASDRLLRDYFGMHRVEWSDDDSVEFELPLGEWIDVFRENGFEIVRLIELRPPDGTTSRFTHVTPEWARRWPTEWIWHLRKSGASARRES